MAAINLGENEKKTVMWLIGAFAAVALAPEFLSTSALQYRDGALSEQRGLEKKISQLRQDLDGIEERKDILRRHLSRYQSLADRGIIAPPDPADLVRHMKIISQERRQEATQFAFRNSILLGADRAKYVADSDVKVSVTPLVLQMGMLHDMDMFMFMQSLGKQVANLSFPVRCTMTRLTEEFEPRQRRNMDGMCEIHWYAVDDPDRLEKEEPEETPA